MLKVNDLMNLDSNIKLPCILIKLPCILIVREVKKLTFNLSSSHFSA